MQFIEVAAIAEEAMRDPEFSREIRFFNGVIRIVIGRNGTDLSFLEGKLLGTAAAAGAETGCKIVIRGSEEVWVEMLQPYPRPFYQCFQTAAVKHGLYMSSSNETFAYLPALNRFLQISRDQHADMVSHA